MNRLLRMACVLAGAMLLVAASRDLHWRLANGVESPPVPTDNPMSDAKVELGRRLFYDADLSANGTLACAGCHEQKRGFADGNATRPGVHGDPGRRNVPGLANVGWMAHLTWADPRNDTLESQALVPLLGERPVEMGMKGLEAELPRRLSADACYAIMFKRAFPEQDGRIDTRTVAAALAAFQRTMIALDTPWDRFQAGATEALSPAARQGSTLFASSGCAQCHSGRDLSDGAFHRLGPIDARDPGLAEATGDQADAGRFRTAPLRNVAITGPWLHDGSAKTLGDAIARHPASPPASAIPTLIAFLEALTDQGFLTNPRFAMPDRACGKPL
ncbi:cytochrome-c peroxidase [Sphingobium aromaticiconvertens]|uniref:cytochrome-c peroxidase n=1 Tax=Sphingobium aromaticiconvertens TaxID=365341 RepID=UPI00301A0944